MCFRTEPQFAPTTPYKIHVLSTVLLFKTMDRFTRYRNYSSSDERSRELERVPKKHKNNSISATISWGQNRCQSISNRTLAVTAYRARYRKTDPSAPTLGCSTGPFQDSLLWLSSGFEDQAQDSPPRTGLLGPFSKCQSGFAQTKLCWLHPHSGLRGHLDVANHGFAQSGLVKFYHWQLVLEGYKDFARNISLRLNSQLHIMAHIQVRLAQSGHLRRNGGESLVAVARLYDFLQPVSRKSTWIRP